MEFERIHAFKTLSTVSVCQNLGRSGVSGFLGSRNYDKASPAAAGYVVKAEATITKGVQFSGLPTLGGLLSSAPHRTADIQLRVIEVHI